MGMVFHLVAAASPGNSSRYALAVIGLLVLAVATPLSWTAMHADKRSRRPGSGPTDSLHSSARLLLAALAVLGISGFLTVLPFTGDVSTIPVLLRLAAGPLMLAGALVLPQAISSKELRTRALIEGFMILTAVTTFAWYFLLGPALFHHWPNLSDAVTGMGYPGLDVVLVSALLVLSVKSRRVRPALWAPLAAAVAAILIADFAREITLQLLTVSPYTLINVLRTLSALLIGATAILLTRLPLEAAVRDLPAESDEVQESDESSPAHHRLWDSFLPFALVPAVAALDVYTWQRHLGADITGGVIIGTAVLVTLTFLRQKLVAEENRRLYQQAATAFERSQEYASTMEKLYEELRMAKEQLQQNNSQLARANQLLHDQATRDPLSGLPNHRAMVQAIDAELNRALRYNRQCSLLFLDLDHFKALNDSCGHLAGDAVLREIVIPVQRALRSEDVAGRWGGEEFVILLPETTLDDALSAGERIRSAVESHRFSSVGGGHLTCSVGVASFPLDSETRDGLIDAADRAMYTAKRLGKNQVRSASDPSVLAFRSEPRTGSTSSREETTTWGVIEALTTLVRAYDPLEDAESVEIAELAMRVASNLGKSASEVRTIGLAARLHDVGMVSVSSDPRPHVVDGDRARLGAHTIVGADIVGRIPALSVLGPMIRGHHERWDGMGYPDRLKGESIPLASRIICACDAYVSLTRPRTGSAPMAPLLALREIKAASGQRFDPKVVSALQDAVSTLTEPVARAS